MLPSGPSEPGPICVISSVLTQALIFTHSPKYCAFVDEKNVVRSAHHWFPLAWILVRLCFYSPCVFTQHLWFDVAGLLICAAAFLSPTPSISRNDCKPLCDIRCNFFPDFHLLLILTHICFCKATQVFKVLCYPSIHFFSTSSTSGVTDGKQCFSNLSWESGSPQIGWFVVSYLFRIAKDSK